MSRGAFVNSAINMTLLYPSFTWSDACECAPSVSHGLYYAVFKFGHWLRISVSVTYYIPPFSTRLLAQCTTGDHTMKKGIVSQGPHLSTRVSILRSNDCIAQVLLKCLGTEVGCQRNRIWWLWLKENQRCSLCGAYRLPSRGQRVTMSPPTNSNPIAQRFPSRCLPFFGEDWNRHPEPIPWSIRSGKRSGTFRCVSCMSE